MKIGLIDVDGHINCKYFKFCTEKAARALGCGRNALGVKKGGESHVLETKT